MIIEILSTGDEVMLGDIVDTNAAWLCGQMKDIGLRVSRITAVGDEVDDLVPVINAISGRADLCIVTGGLGPTQDDVTALAFSQADGKTLEINSKARQSMVAFFDKKGWQLSPENEKQALMPAGATVLENCCGTAPGFGIQIQNCSFYCLPGVPGEMTQMFAQQVRPVLMEKTGAVAGLDIRRLTVFGLPESVVGSRLSEFDRLYPGIALGFRAKFPLIEVKLVRSGKKADKDKGLDHVAPFCDPDMEGALAWVVGQLGHRVVSMAGLTLEQEVGRLLSETGQTLSAAESCTGGLISHQITDVAGASAYFLFSAVTYANQAKMDILNVKQETLDTCGAVHEETARQMAAGARDAGRSDWAVATTGIAGPSGGSPDKPVGTVCIGVAGPNGVWARKFVLDTGDRERNKALFAATALEMLRRGLTLQPASS